jgi:hypothetical protein
MAVAVASAPLFGAGAEAGAENSALPHAGKPLWKFFARNEESNV